MASDGERSRVLEIDGMSCGHCVRAVREVLESVPGVRVEEVTLGTARVQMESPDALARVQSRLEDEGYSLRQGEDG